MLHLFCFLSFSVSYPSVTDVNSLLCVALKIKYLERFGLNVGQDCSLLREAIKDIDVKSHSNSSGSQSFLIILLPSSVDMIVF